MCCYCFSCISKYGSWMPNAIFVFFFSAVTCLQLLIGVWQLLLFCFITVFGLLKLCIIYVSSNCWYIHFSVNASNHWYLLSTCLQMMYCVYACGFVCLNVYFFIFSQILMQYMTGISFKHVESIQEDPWGGGFHLHYW